MEVLRGKNYNESEECRKAFDLMLVNRRYRMTSFAPLSFFLRVAKLKVLLQRSEDLCKFRTAQTQSQSGTLVPHTLPYFFSSLLLNLC